MYHESACKKFADAIFGIIQKWHGVKVGLGPQDLGLQDPRTPQSLMVGPGASLKVLEWNPRPP